jgi:hypothetical protein
VVTLTGSTWPSALVAEYMLKIGSSLYRVNTRDSSTQCTLYDTTLDAAAGTTYVLYRVNYPIGTDFGGWLDPITLENENRGVQEMATIPAYELRGFSSVAGPRAGKPEAFAVTHLLATNTLAVPTYYLSIYPLVDAKYVLTGRYRVQPGDALGETGSATIIDPLFSECLLESILSVAEQNVFDAPGVHTQRYMETLVQCIEKDKLMRGTRRLKPQDAPSRVRNFQLLIAPVEYTGD